MIKLKGLEDWAREILEVPTPELNRCLTQLRTYDEIESSIEKLPFYTPYRPIFRTLSAATLLDLSQKLRGQKVEAKFWILMLPKLDNSLPDELALDLMARYPVDSRLIQSLGHSRQSDEVMWKLASLVDEALLTLAKRFYTVARWGTQEFEQVLNRFPDHEWMLQSLAYCSASSVEKRHAYEKAIENHPQREHWLSINQKIKPNQRPFLPFDLTGLSSDERMMSLYGGYSPQQLLEISRGDHTPDEILHELENLPGSREVRFNARHSLRRRAESEPDSQF